MELQSWLFTVSPYEGESISHFLGRFRRANDLSVTGLSTMAQLGGVIARWEKFRFIPSPTRQEIEALARVCQVSLEELIQTFPSASMKLEPIWLCSACYAEQPCHRMEWQYQGAKVCSKHHTALVSQCPRCISKTQKTFLMGVWRVSKVFSAFWGDG